MAGGSVSIRVDEQEFHPHPNLPPSRGKGLFRVPLTLTLSPEERGTIALFQYQFSPGEGTWALQVNRYFIGDSVDGDGDYSANGEDDGG